MHLTLDSYVIIIIYTRDVWHLLHRSPRALVPKGWGIPMPCILSAHDITSLYPVGIATIETKWSVWREGQQEIAGSKRLGQSSIDHESNQYTHYSVSLLCKHVLAMFFKQSTARTSYLCFWARHCRSRIVHCPSWMAVAVLYGFDHTSQSRDA